ncbi:alpha/beta fold hydrolase [Solicola sp. PLA-1-18]|uniref:alpha/beta fold hydrolase n=1 Tax=Solicola sp. PLA-1-18 TaxID=3380532 RepID=UPI003B7EE63D
MTTDLFEHLDVVDLDLGGTTVHARSGAGHDPVLLLHGWPQTHAMWHQVASSVAPDHAVVVPDLRGYGASRTTGDDRTFRAMASDVVALMDHLGHDRFHVVGHDRGARTAHRLALDHPGRVASVMLLDVLPTLDVWRLMDSWLALRYYHWTFLAQPGGLPERLIGGDPVTYLHQALGALGAGPDVLDPRALAAYEEAARDPAVVHGWCADYRAAAHEDREHDAADLGRTVDVPATVVWGAKGVVGAQEDPLERWRRWFPRATGTSVDAGHFMVEERPDLLVPLVLEHLARR